MAPRQLVAVAVLCGGVALAGCSSGSGPSSSPSTKTPVAATTTRPPASSTATTTMPITQNLAVTDDVRAALLQAGATLKGLPASDFTGLVPGRTYYAFDSATDTYWAAAGLAPSPSSIQAQVSSQDDGAYLLFSRPSGGAWTAVNDGLGGIAGSACPAPVPAAILSLWNWPPGSCNPPG